MSHHVYAGVLLQHTRHRYLCTSVCYDISRYTYHSYPRSYIRDTTCSQVAHPDYFGCEHLKTVSRDKLLSHFCEAPWGGKQNTPCSGFAKCLRFLNMVMTFTLTPFSHYNFITEPCARFLLSLLEDLSIEFPSHFITSVLDVD